MVQWRVFEELVAHIYRELSPNAAVNHNDHILGKASQVERQIDVSIRHTIAGHNLLTIVQARDYKKPADINDVGEFASVIEDVGANKGILVCKGGFTDGAKKLAERKGIDLCNIHDAQSRKWNLDIQLPVIWIDLMPQVRYGMAVFLNGGESIPKSPEDWLISNDQGRTRVTMSSTFVNAWNAGVLPREVGCEHRVYPTQQNCELLILDAQGKAIWRSIQDLRLSYRVSRKAWLGSFSPEQCRGILHYSDGTFRPSYLPIGAVPALRDENWREVEEPDELVVTIPGCVVTTEEWQLIVGSETFSETSFKRVSK